ncbi:MAG: DNA mismatch repair protein MutS [Deltaproteobacteria bacterium]|nr:DNA mismatch repair protein MutS [Deltaproteobacteria bacterium]
MSAPLEATGPAASDSALDPRAAYDAGLAEAAHDEAFWKARARLVSNARLACFAALLATGWAAFGTHTIDRAWIAAPLLAFIALVIAHDRVLQRKARASRVRRFFEDGLARLDDRWAGRGDTGDRYQDPRHPYAQDLDVFGAGSLFELLATTRTTTGSDRLATWLREAAPPETIRERQAAVGELRPRLEMRLEMAIAGDEAGSSTQQGELEAWASAPAVTLSRSIFFLALSASALSLAGLATWVLTDAGPVPFVTALLIQSALALSLRSRVRPILAAAETPVGSLARTASLLACVENEHFESPLLARLRFELETTGRPPSGEFEALHRLVDRRDARNNQFFAPIAALLMWGTHAALALEAWRARCGPRLVVWIESAGEIEALCALASHAYEHPQDPFPEIVEGGPLFEGEGLGHPLLPVSRAVRNDLRLEGRPRALVMSGSNMSGKSTMLRTVGSNTILALAGAPVRARRLRISPLRIAASIRIVDSLQDGQSHFMAEIVRLRQVVEISGSSPPALFLLDEILHGTNSHDRRIGAEAVISGLVEKGALGIVTTHDLALTEIVPASDGRLANVHFEDHLEDGEMEFDYALREGVVEKSNALALMRSVGLDV